MSDRQTTRIDRPLEDLVEILSARPATWVVPFMRIAAHAGEAAAGRLVGESSPPGPRAVSVDLLEAASAGPDSVVVPLRWHTGGFRWVPTSFAGRVVLNRISETACEVTLDGTYVVPDAPGQGAATAASAAVETAIATFLRSLRAAAEEQARSSV